MEITLYIVTYIIDIIELFYIKNIFHIFYAVLAIFVPDQRVISILNTRESIYKKISFIFICFTTYVKNPLKSQRNTSMCLFVRCGEIILIRVIIILR